jgi:AcrR family transcriptional regulator
MYRSLVLESAERVFAERGYHASRMQDVAAEAGISLATLYARFPSKRALFATLHEARGREFLAAIEPALRGPTPARDALREAVEAYVNWIHEHPAYFQVDLREGRSWAIGDVEGSPTFQEGIGLWTELMTRGVAEGVFHDDAPELMASTAFGVMQIQVAALLFRHHETDVDRVSRRVARAVERLVCLPEDRRSGRSAAASPRRRASRAGR